MTRPELPSSEEPTFVRLLEGLELVCRECDAEEYPPEDKEKLQAKRKELEQKLSQFQPPQHPAA